MTNEKIIYTSWMAYELRKLGYEIIRTEINPKHPHLDCYVFEDSKEFERDLHKISKRGRK